MLCVSSASFSPPKSNVIADDLPSDFFENFFGLFFSHIFLVSQAINLVQEVAALPEHGIHYHVHHRNDPQVISLRSQGKKIQRIFRIYFHNKSRIDSSSSSISNPRKKRFGIVVLAVTGYLVVFEGDLTKVRSVPSGGGCRVGLHGLLADCIPGSFSREHVARAWTEWVWLKCTRFCMECECECMGHEHCDQCEPFTPRTGLTIFVFQNYLFSLLPV